MANPISEVTEALAAQLRTISGLSVIKNFPAANQKLAFPSATISTPAAPKFRSDTPVKLSQTDPNGQNQVTTVYEVGQYDFQFQLDIWARNQIERDQVFDAIFAKLNPDIEPMGLRLVLVNYYNLIAGFTVVDQQIVADEASAQRQEWRIKIDVLATCKAVLSRTDYAIITIANNLSTPDTL